MKAKLVNEALNTNPGNLSQDEIHKKINLLEKSIKRSTNKNGNQRFCKNIVERVNLLKTYLTESLNESVSRYCAIYKAENGSWYLELANDEYDDRDEATTYGPFNSEEKADNYLSQNFSNPGGMNISDSGDEPVPTMSPNGRPVVKPGGGGGRMIGEFRRY